MPLHSLLIVLLGLVLAASSPLEETPAGSKSGDELEAKDRLAAEEAKLDVLSRKLDDLRDELDGLDRRETTVLGELHRLELEILHAGETLDLLKLELDRGYREIDETLAEIQTLEASMAELEPFLASRSESLYKLGKLSYLRLLLSIEEPRELTRAYRYISRLARSDAQKMGLFLENQAGLESAKASLIARTREMLDKRQELEAASASLEQRRRSQQVLLKEIEGRLEMGQTLLVELEEAGRQLGQLVHRLTEGESTSDTVTLPIVMFRGELTWPLNGRIKAGFGKQRHPLFKTVTVQNGIELEANLSEEVSTIYDGEVVYADWFRGYGKLLIIRHPRQVYSLYGHLSDFTVETHQHVQQGDLIGLAGETGSLSGPILYFEIREDGRPVDPLDWLAER